MDRRQRHIEVRFEIYNAGPRDKSNSGFSKIKKPSKVNFNGLNESAILNNTMYAIEAIRRLVEELRRWPRRINEF